MFNIQKKYLSICDRFFVGHELIFELRLPIKRCRFGWQHCVFGLGRESFSSHFGNLFQKGDKPRC